MAKFTSIRTGMSKAEVFSVLGVGELVSENSIDAGQFSVHTEMFAWRGSWGANCNVMFQNDKVMSKAQFGLK